MRLTDFGENRMADKMRGTTPPYHATNWYVALGSAASDSSFTEITGTDLPRVAIARNTTAWAATNGAGTTTNPSTGSSALTSNNANIQFAAATSNRGSAAYVGLFDASTAGNCWAWIPMPGGPVTVNITDEPVIAAGALALTFMQANGATQYLQNKMIDEFFRGVAYSWPASIYGQLFVSGVEASGGSYARAALASSTAALSGTQAAGSTSASSGTGGRISNNTLLTYPTPTAGWGDADEEGWSDASTAGNTLILKSFASPVSITTGNAPSHAPDSLGFTFA